MQYFELYYASSEASIDTSRDGFGVRTYTQGFPERQKVVDILRNKNLLFYEAGEKKLASVHELVENPDIVLSYPATLAYFQEFVGDQTLFFLVCTRFIGRDYGWYLDPPDQGARSGNVFAHVLVFEKDFPLNLFDVLTDPHFFKPIIGYDQQENNISLKRLLTGKPELLLPQFFPTAASLDSEEDSYENTIAMHHGIKAIILALSAQKPLVIRETSGKTLSLLSALLKPLPKFMLHGLSICTNFQHFNLHSDYQIICINEYYSHAFSTEEESYLLCDIIEGAYSEVILADAQNEFEDLLQNLIIFNDWEEISAFQQFWGDKISHYSPEIDFHRLAELYKQYTHQTEGEKTLMELYAEINHYPLTQSFKDSIYDDIYNLCLEALESGNQLNISKALINISRSELAAQSHPKRDEINNKLNNLLTTDADFAHEFFKNKRSLEAFSSFLQFDRLAKSRQVLFGEHVQLPPPIYNELFKEFYARASHEKVNLLTHAFKSRKFLAETCTTLFASEPIDDFKKLLFEGDFFAAFFKDQASYDRFLGAALVRFIEATLPIELAPLQQKLLGLTLRNPFLYKYFHHVMGLFLEAENEKAEAVDLLIWYIPLLKHPQILRAVLLNSYIDQILIDYHLKRHTFSYASKDNLLLKSFEEILDEFKSLSKIGLKQAQKDTLDQHIKLISMIIEMHQRSKDSTFESSTFIKKYKAYIPMSNESLKLALMLQFIISSINNKKWEEQGYTQDFLLDVGKNYNDVEFDGSHHQKRHIPLAVYFYFQCRDVLLKKEERHEQGESLAKGVNWENFFLSQLLALSIFQKSKGKKAPNSQSIYAIQDAELKKIIKPIIEDMRHLDKHAFGAAMDRLEKKNQAMVEFIDSETHAGSVFNSLSQKMGNAGKNILNLFKKDEEDN